MNAGDERGGWVAQECIGQGGVGEVWRCMGPDERVGALKVLLIDTKEVDRHRFGREMAALRKLRHRAIVGLIDAGFDEKQRPWLVMEYVEGQPLEEYIEEHGALEQDQCVNWFAELADGLAHAHANGVHHRDIKANNVLVRPDGGLTIVDFGAAILDGSSRVTKAGAVLGTVSYMPPEVVLGEPEDPVRTDIYAMGQLLWECLRGELAFRPPMNVLGLKRYRAVFDEKLKVAALDPGSHFPDRLRAAVRSATSAEPENRLTAMEQLADALDVLRSGGRMRTPLRALRREAGDSLAPFVDTQDVPRLLDDDALTGPAPVDEPAGRPWPILVAVGVVLATLLAWWALGWSRV